MQTNPDAPSLPPAGDWYSDAKFGIFIHWGPASVPAWAPQTEMNVQKMIRDEGLAYYFRHNPYADWYRNTAGIEGSPTWEHHQKAWAGQPYENFGARFRVSSTRDRCSYFADWAKLFARAGARYVVPVAKHHDGFTLWPTKVPPRVPGWSSEADLIGLLREQVLQHGLRFGVYYSGLYDWTWNSTVISNPLRAMTNGAQSPDVLRYMDGHVKELIDLYKPDVVWNDIGYVTHGNLPGSPAPTPFATLADLWAYYRANVPDGRIDDRWFEIPAGNPIAYSVLASLSGFLDSGGGTQLLDCLDALLKQSVPGYDKPPGGLTFPPMQGRPDFRTFEYEVPPEIATAKWELVRGIGLSFCCNLNELPNCRLTREQLIRLFVDVVSKNGNLLLNVGPQCDGSLQKHEVLLLEEFGAWMQIYGPALYGTVPWDALPSNLYEGPLYTRRDDDGSVPLLRYTVKDDTLNVFFDVSASPSKLSLPCVLKREYTSIYLRTGPGKTERLGHFSEDAAGLHIQLPSELPPGPICALTISPVPEWGIRERT